MFFVTRLSLTRNIGDGNNQNPVKKVEKKLKWNNWLSLHKNFVGLIIILKENVFETIKKMSLKRIKKQYTAVAVLEQLIPWV